MENYGFLWTFYVFFSLFMDFYGLFWIFYFLKIFRKKDFTRIF